MRIPMNACQISALLFLGQRDKDTVQIEGLDLWSMSLGVMILHEICLCDVRGNFNAPLLLRC